jgi:uncharacterized phage-associated protein
VAYDVRAIANFVLDLAQQDGREVSNLVVNKVVYFLHAHYLVQFGEPLVSAKVEAWDFGPVFRELYKEFKKFEKGPIKKRAQRLSANTGEPEICEYKFSHEDGEFLASLTKRYVQLSPTALVALSHEKGGPWDQVWNHDSAANASMCITDEIIKAWYAQAARH